MKKRALISVSDKVGIVDFARELIALGYEIISTGGTAHKFAEENINVKEVSEITGFPECLDGRVKTLDPHVHAGLLAVRGNKKHMEQLAKMNIDPIDIVVINLYPFKQTILKENVDLETAIENIDIGGPSMLRSAAKNYQDVSVLVDPNDYNMLLDDIINFGKPRKETNFYLAAKAFAHTAHYDSLISNYLNKIQGIDFPQSLSISYEKIQDLRYGENPHQSAAYYRDITNEKGLLTGAVQIHGKELSYNNINDTNGALDLCKEFDKPAVVACKHSNPCGVGTGDDIYEAWQKAYKADPKSIFGGIIVANREIDAKTASEINKIFIEIVLAPSFSYEALEILKSKINIRLMLLPELANKKRDNLELRKVSGGLLVQMQDNELLFEDKLKCVTDRKPTEKEMEDLIFAWKLCKYVKSNGIAIAKDGQSLGLGTGQVNRVWATTQAIDHCKEALGEEILKGSALASDAFFPFTDSVRAAAEAGITAIIQPGGSVNDNGNIEVCNQYGITMLFTEIRHFKH